MPQGLQNTFRKKLMGWCIEFSVLTGLRSPCRVGKGHIHSFWKNCLGSKTVLEGATGIRNCIQGTSVSLWSWSLYYKGIQTFATKHKRAWDHVLISEIFLMNPHNSEFCGEGGKEKVRKGGPITKKSYSHTLKCKEFCQESGVYVLGFKGLRFSYYISWHTEQLDKIEQ